MNSAIVLEGGDTITADPPAGAPGALPPALAGAASLGLLSAGLYGGAPGGLNNVSLGSSFGGAAGGGMGYAISNIVGVAPVTAAALGASFGNLFNRWSRCRGYVSSAIPVNNWNLPTTFAINANLADGISTPLINATGTVTGTASGAVSGTASGTAAEIATGTVTGTAAPATSDSRSGSVGEGSAVSLTRTLTNPAGTAGDGITAGGSKRLSGSVSNNEAKILQDGVTLLAPKAATKLATSFGEVNVAGGAVVLVMAFDGGLAVYDLHDTKSGAVKVTVGGESISLAPGQNGIFTDRKIRCFEDINPAQMVAYRNVVASDLGNGAHCFKSEFNAISMMQGVGGLRRLLREQDSDTRKAMGAVLKTSFILSQLGGPQYQYMAPHPVSAMATPVTAINGQ